MPVSIDATARAVAAVAHGEPASPGHREDLLIGVDPDRVHVHREALGSALRHLHEDRGAERGEADAELRILGVQVLEEQPVCLADRRDLLVGWGPR